MTCRFSVFVCLLILATNSRAQDGLPLSRGLEQNYTLDNSIDDGTDVFVSRWVSSQSQGFGPLGSSSYKGEVQVLHRLRGNCPEKVPCSFKVWTVPKPEVTWKVPESGDIRLVLGKYHADQKMLSIRRFLEPTTENIELVAAVIRQHKAKELAADPAKEKQLVEGLAAAVKAAARPVPDKGETKQEDESVPTFDDSWWWIGGGILLAAALLIWQQQRIRKE
ncbi:MAG: hypothetical protein JNG86_22935 [Verrucomicrobiaceae bacterium]|nr:hypothetical protein [Verrucomicrobiaceae bacterium]